jgi:hypothetical protein
MKADQFDICKLASPGLFIDLHPRLTNEARLQTQINNLQITQETQMQTILENFETNIKSNTATNAETMNTVLDTQMQNAMATM